jgi:hypothetical protein
MKPLTTAELAAFLGLTTSGLRNVISRKHVPPVGKIGRANLYNPRVVIDAAGPRDRRAA